MTKKRAIIVFLAGCLWATCLNIHSRELAVTIDDLPFVGVADFTVKEKYEMFTRIRETLKKYKTKIIGFALGRSTNRDTAVFLDDLVRDGHLIGNHSYSHFDLNKTPVEIYTNDILKGEQALKKWLGSKKYFRFPMLHRGDVQEKKDRVALYLKNNTYAVVPVTIDNDEWMFNRDYSKALKAGDRAGAAKIGAGYLRHMKEETRRNVALAQKKLGRDVKHILLIHMNAINADFLDPLLAWYKREGWAFITVEEALSDPVYGMTDRYLGKWGWSWLRRITPNPPN